MRTSGFAVLSPTKGWRLRLAALLGLAAFAGRPAVAGAQVTTDPNAGSSRPRIDVTANGLPLVQITNPSAAGVSRNMYGEFNVDGRGLLFNNSLTLTQTQLAGYVAANPNLRSSARLILNEVTGGEASRLGGFMEVAGAKADVVIANQNGITCNGCGFINAGRGTLTTGTPVFGGAGTLDALRVTGGEIAVEGLGLNANDIDRLDLVSRTLKLNAGVWAKELSAVTGPNQVGYADGSVTPLSPSCVAPEVSLDVSALGGMYAGKIRLVGTEKGVGVVSQGKLASAGEFTLTSEGKIVLSGSTSSGGPMTIATSGGIDNRGTLYSAGDLGVHADAALENASTIAAQGQLELDADSVRTSGTLAAGVTPDGKIAQASHLLVTAANGLDATGQLMAGGIVSLDAGSMSLAGASVQSGGDTYLQARNGGVAAAGWKEQAGGSLFVNASGSFEGTGGSLLAANVQIQAASIELATAQVQSVGDTDLVATSGGVGSAGGLLQAGGALRVNSAGAFGGAGGQILAHDIKIDAASIDLTSGSTRAAADMSLESTSGDIVNRGGTVQANGDVAATAAGSFDNDGGTVAGRSVQIAADSIRTGALTAGVTPDGTAMPDGNLLLQATNGVDAAGQRLAAGGIVSIEGGSLNIAGVDIQSGDDTYLTADRGDIAAARSNVQAAGNLWVEATGGIDGANATLHADNVQIQGGRIHLSSAQVRSARNTLVEGSGDVAAGGALFQAGGRLELTAQGAFAGAQAQISGVGDDLDSDGAPQVDGVPDVNGVSIEGTSVDLTGARVESGRDAWIEATAGDVAKPDCTFQAGGTLTLTSSGALDNSGGHLLGSEVDVTVATIDMSRSASIEAASNLNLTVTGGDVVNTGATLLANSDLTVSTSGTFDNTGGTVMGTNVTIMADDIRQEGEASVIAARQNVNLYPRQSLLNTNRAWIFAQGNILIAGDPDLDGNGEYVKARSVTNESGKIEADGDLTIAAAAITNRTHVLETTEVWIDGYDESVQKSYLLPERGGTFTSYYVDFNRVDRYRVTVTEDSGTASLLAGGQITLLAGDPNLPWWGIVNDMGVIAAGGRIDALGPGAFTNQDSVPSIITRTVSHWKDVYRGCLDTDIHDGCSHVKTLEVPQSDIVEHRDDVDEGWCQNGHHADGTPCGASGGGPGIGNVTNGVNVSAPGSASPTLGSIGRVTNDGVSTSGPSSSAPTFTFTIPQSGLYTLHDDPGYPYLVETDPRFTNLKDFLSSSYMLGQLGVDPEATLKRLGDGFYEQRLVLDQVTELTGRRYLVGYSDGEDEYKALMDAGVRYAKELKLKVGVTLTAEQMSKLTSPMVWLVEEDVGGHRVLAPRLYLPPGGVERVKGSGMVTAGNDLYINMEGDFTNTGTISAGGNADIRAQNISGTGGSLSAGNELVAIAKKDVALRAVDVRAQGKIDVVALEGDVTADTVSVTRHRGTLASGEWGEETTTIGTTFRSSAGNVSIVAFHDVQLDAADLEAGKDLTVQAVGGNVVLGGTVDSRTEERRGSSGNVTFHERTYDETWKGTNLVAGGKLSVSAFEGEGSAADGQSGNVLLTGATIQGNGLVIVYGQNDVITQEGREKHESLTETEKHESSWLGFVETTTTTHDEVNQDLAVKNQITGGAAWIKGERDLTLRGADVAAAGDVQLTAGRDLTITTAEDRVYESHEKKVVTSGFLTSGVGIMVGTRTRTDQAGVEMTANVGSVVGSVGGTVTIEAGGDARIQGSDVISKVGTSITGENVTIEALTDRQSTAQSTEVKQAGFGVSVGGGVVDAATGIYDSARRGSEVKDERLKALYALRAARTGYEAGASLLRGASAADGIGVQAGFSASGSRSETDTRIGAVRGSLIQSEGAISITARGDPNQEKGDLTVTGSTIQGRDVALEASRDVVLQSAANTLDSESGSTSYSASIGVSVGVGKGGGGLGITAKGSLSKGDEGESNVAHAESVVGASGTLSVKSGRDLTLRGAQASGESLAVDVGRNLLVESEQDTSEYHSKSMSVSGQATIAIYGSSSASASASLAKTDSAFRSVVEQSGFYAGSGGYQIKVAGNTNLVGGVISSEAPQEKNVLDTATLTHSNIENESKYSAWSAGFTAGSGGVTPTVGVPAQGEKKSTTYAAVSPATIHTGSDTSGLSRDVANANHPIGNIFDKEKVAEKQELATVFGQEAFKAVGDIAKARTDPYVDAKKAEEDAGRYRDLKGKTDLTGDEQAFVSHMESLGVTAQNVDGIIAQAQADEGRYREQYETWKNGSVAMVLLHTGAGAAQAGLGGGNILAGGLGAGLSEGMAPVTEGLSSKDRRWASLGIGMATGGLAGGSGTGALSGGATALTGEEFNREAHQWEVKRGDDWIARAVQHEEAYAKLSLLGKMVDGLNPAGHKAQAEILRKNEAAFRIAIELAPEGAEVSESNPQIFGTPVLAEPWAVRLDESTGTFYSPGMDGYYISPDPLPMPKDQIPQLRAKAAEDARFGEMLYSSPWGASIPYGWTKLLGADEETARWNASLGYGVELVIDPFGAGGYPREKSVAAANGIAAEGSIQWPNPQPQFSLLNEPKPPELQAGSTPTEYGPFYRTEEDPLDVARVRASGHVAGLPRRGFYASNSSLVKAWVGPLPEDVPGFEFYTTVPTREGTPPHLALWGEEQGATSGTIGDRDAVFIPVRVSRDSISRPPEGTGTSSEPASTPAAGRTK